MTLLSLSFFYGYFSPNKYELINNQELSLLANLTVNSALRTITIFLHALLALLIPNTTANHIITYTNVLVLVYTYNDNEYQDGLVSDDFKSRLTVVSRAAK